MKCIRPLLFVLAGLLASCGTSSSIESVSRACATPAAPVIKAASATVFVMRDFIFTPLKVIPYAA